jgi:hypothetical protein
VVRKDRSASRSTWGPPSRCLPSTWLGYHLRRYLATYRVEGSLDGDHWLALAEKSIAVPPLASFRADPTRVRQRIELSPATIRYLRIGPYRRPPGGLAPDTGFDVWGVAELWAYSPPPGQ